MWSMGVLMGKGCILIMVERRSKLNSIGKLKRKRAFDVVRAMNSCFPRCSNLVVHTITSDNGKEIQNALCKTRGNNTILES